MNHADRIVVDPKVMMGKPVIRGTRIPVYVVLNLLAEGYDAKKIIREYPDLIQEDVAAAVKYAARMTHFEESVLPTPVSV